jgi:hypothetical protein
VKTIRGVSEILVAILTLAGAIAVPSCIRAQAFAGGQFKLSHSVRWGNAVLPTGNFIYSIDNGAGSTVVRVQQIGGSFAALFLPQTQSEGSDSSLRGIVLVLTRIGEESVVTSLHVQERGLVLNFSPPNLETEDSHPAATETRSISVNRDPAQGYFTIFNPANEEVSYGEAERIYLAACETIEREFNQSTPIRPRLTVHLHSTENNLHYPDRDLRLAKWDKNKFAEAVVELVLHDMISPEDRQRLTKLAVAQAGAIVNLCELKDCK